MLALAGAAPALAAADRVRVLLLDYFADDEHDVLQSFLCVEPCTERAGCPEALRSQGVDYWSDDFVVFRPKVDGDARSMIERFRDANVDLLSLSGHHASGFSGGPGAVRFDTERLGRDLADVAGVAPFFTHPAMVMLQGCRTDVESSFTGDPREYIRHVIEETDVRRNEFDRLLAAVQQIGGVQQAYRSLFPNACILGYSGTQAPGGRFEIYSQVNGWLRALAVLQAAGVEPPRRFDPPAAGESKSAFAALNRKVEAECARGLALQPVRARRGVLRPAGARSGRASCASSGSVLQSGGRGSRGADRLESALESGSFYQNTTWSCSSGAPKSAPQYPNPVDESPFARTFAELVLLPFGTLSENERARLHEELVHRLGTIELREPDRAELDDWLTANSSRVDAFVHGPLRTYSTFRQRDFFRLLARAGCSPCFASVFKPEAAALLRQNAAASLLPAVGSTPYRWALLDADPRVRRAAAERLDPIASTRRCSIWSAATPIPRFARRWSPLPAAAATDLRLSRRRGRRCSANGVCHSLRSRRCRRRGRRYRICRLPRLPFSSSGEQLGAACTRLAMPLNALSPLWRRKNCTSTSDALRRDAGLFRRRGRAGDAQTKLRAGAQLVGPVAQHAAAGRGDGARTEHGAAGGERNRLAQAALAVPGAVLLAGREGLLRRLDVEGGGAGAIARHRHAAVARAVTAEAVERRAGVGLAG